jgi:peptidyl-prolyl cis-trans isomerase C
VRFGALGSRGLPAGETTANTNSGSKKVATFEGGEVTEGELQQFAEQSGLGELDPESPSTRRPCSR